MPGVVIPIRSGESRVRKMVRSTEKAVQAEMRNKREAARLTRQTRMYDKQLSRTRHELDKECKTAGVLLTRMKETTGRSSEGRELRGPGDRVYVNSAYARTTMSGKRMRQWRGTEEQFQRDYGAALRAVRAPSQPRDTPEDAADKLSIVLGMMGYEEDDVARILAHIERSRASDASAIKQANLRSRSLRDMRLTRAADGPDIYECLRDTPDSAGAAQRTSNDRGFSMEEWERALLEGYATVASEAPVRVRKPRRIRSASAICRQFSRADPSPRVNGAHASGGHSNGASSTSLSNSHPASRGAVNTVARAYSQPLLNSARSVDPGTIRWASKSVVFKDLSESGSSHHSSEPSEPDTDTDAMKTAPRRHSVRPYSTTGVRNGSLAVSVTLKRPQSSTASGRRVSYSDERLPTSTPRDNPDQEAVGDDHVLSDVNDVIPEEDDQGEEGVGGEAVRMGLGSDSTTSLRSAASNDSKGSNKSDVFDIATFPTSLNTEMTPEVGTMPSTQRRRGSILKTSASTPQLPHFPRAHRASFSVPLREHDFGLGPPPRSRHDRDTVSVSSAPGPNVSDAPHPASQLRRASMPANVYKQRLSSQRSVHSEGVEEEDEELVAEDGESGALIPRWKRDLLREAPATLSSPGARLPASATLSKARRLRELERLKDENVNDVVRLCGEEHLRRRQSRMNVFMTMMRVKQAVETLSHRAEETRSRSTTQSSTGSEEGT